MRQPEMWKNIFTRQRGLQFPYKDKQNWSIILWSFLLLTISFYTYAEATQSPTRFVVRLPSTGRDGACYTESPGPPIQALQELRVYRVYFPNDTTQILSVPLPPGMEGDTLQFTIPPPTPGKMGVIYPIAVNNVGESCIGTQYVFAEPYTEAPPIQYGLSGDYFNNQDFTAYAFTRIDPIIDFEWANAVPDPLIQAFTFSVLWRGFINIPTQDIYNFYADTNDGVRLYIDNATVIDDWSCCRVERTGQIVLTQGLHPITIEYFQEFGEAAAHLKWSSSLIPKQIVPASALSH